MPKRMKSKIQPAEMKIATVLGRAGKNYADLSQMASILNRRFYRQGLNWAVSHFTFYKTTPTDAAGAASGVSVSKLPNTWVMSNAWEKSFRAWQQMIKNAVDESGTQSIKGKFLDYKIFMNAQHHSAGAAANLLPYDNNNNVATPGQWDMSTIQVPTVGTGINTDWELIAIGQNNPGVGASGYDAKSIVVGYANSRALPNIEDPNTPDDASDIGQNWMLSLFTDGTQQDSEVIDVLESTGDQPPYPFENDGTHTDTMYPGGETQLPGTRLVGAAFFNAGTNANKVVIEGDNFPCGLVEFTTTEDDVKVIIHLVPGNHRGYLAEPMTEM